MQLKITLHNSQFPAQYFLPISSPWHIPINFIVLMDPASKSSHVIVALRSWAPLYPLSYQTLVFQVLNFRFGASPGNIRKGKNTEYGSFSSHIPKLLINLRHHSIWSVYFGKYWWKLYPFTSFTLYDFELKHNWNRRWWKLKGGVGKSFVLVYWQSKDLFIPKLNFHSILWKSKRP